MCVSLLVSSQSASFVSLSLSLCDCLSVCFSFIGSLSLIDQQTILVTHSRIHSDTQSIDIKKKKTHILSSTQKQQQEQEQEKKKAKKEKVLKVKPEEEPARLYHQIKPQQMYQYCSLYIRLLPFSSPLLYINLKPRLTKLITGS